MAPQSQGLSSTYLILSKNSYFFSDEIFVLGTAEFFVRPNRPTIGNDNWAVTINSLTDNTDKNK